MNALWLISRWWDGWYRLQTVMPGNEGPKTSTAIFLACSVAGARAFVPVGAVPALVPLEFVGAVEAWTSPKPHSTSLP